MKPATSSAPYTVRNGVATWIVDGPLDISGAAELHKVSVTIFKDKRVKCLNVELPEGLGVPLPAFQILHALQRDMRTSGKSCEVSGHLEPLGGRAW